MNQQELERFMNQYGKLLTDTIKEKLAESRNFSPGFDGTAYSQGRNPDFGGVAPKSLGNLYNSIDYEYDAGEDTLSIFMASYWRYVEYGRRPGKYVPIQPLKEWLRGKNQDENAAFAISKNIFKFGIEPTNFYGQSLDMLAGELDKQFAEKADELIDELFDRIQEKDVTIEIDI